MNKMIFIHKAEFTTVLDGKSITYRKIVFLTEKGYSVDKCTDDVYKSSLRVGQPYTVFYDKFGRVCQVC